MFGTGTLERSASTDGLEAELTPSPSRRRRAGIMAAVPALVLALAVGTTATVAAASRSGAYANPGYGGSAETLATTYAPTGALDVRATVRQYNGGSQTIGARLRFYSQPHAAWIPQAWKTINTLDPYGITGSTAAFKWAFRGLPRGNYFIRMDYAWLTTGGWNILTRDLGWIAI